MEKSKQPAFSCNANGLQSDSIMQSYMSYPPFYWIEAQPLDTH